MLSQSVLGMLIQDILSRKDCVNKRNFTASEKKINREEEKRRNSNLLVAQAIVVALLKAGIDVAKKKLSTVLIELSQLFWPVHLENHPSFYFLVKFQPVISSLSASEIRWQLALSYIHGVLYHSAKPFECQDYLCNRLWVHWRISYHNYIVHQNYIKSHLIKSYKFDVLWGKSIEQEWSLKSVKIVCSYGNKTSASAQVVM